MIHIPYASELFESMLDLQAVASRTPPTQHCLKRETFFTELGLSKQFKLMNADGSIEKTATLEGDTFRSSLFPKQRQAWDSDPISYTSEKIGKYCQNGTLLEDTMRRHDARFRRILSCETESDSCSQCSSASDYSDTFDDFKNKANLALIHWAWSSWQVLSCYVSWWGCHVHHPSFVEKWLAALESVRTKW